MIRRATLLKTAAPIREWPRRVPAYQPRNLGRRKQKRIRALYRNHPGPSSSASSPLYAFAIGANNGFQATGNIVSSQSWVIRDIFQTPSASTISIEFEVVPKPTPTTVSLRVHGGLNGVTRGIHPADSKQVATEVPWTLTPTADPYVFVLAGSTWVAGSVVWKGGAVAYVPSTIQDCAAQLNTLAKWARDNAPAAIFLPFGGLYIQTATIFWPEGCSVIGQGGKKTFFFLADAADMVPANSVHHMMGTGTASGTKYGNVTDTVLRGFALFGCRQHNRFGAGDHSLDLGSDSDTANRIMNVWLDDITNIGSAGYGCSWGGHNSKLFCKVTNYEGAFSDGDGFDCKNRDDDNFVVNYFAPNMGWHAMGSQGTNLQPVLTLGTDPITITTTTPGASQFTISRPTDPNCSPGEIGTFTGPTFNGINLTGSFRCVALTGSVSSGTITFETDQTASGTGTGGGTGMTFVCPHISTGDVAIDGRGIGTNIYGGSWIGECFGRNVFRGRGGAAGQGNGLGASYMNIIGVVGVDLTPAWVATTTNTGNFIALNGIGQKAISWSFETSGGSTAATLAATSNGCVVGDFYAKGAATALDLRGDRFKVHDGIIEDYTVLGASLDGSSVSVSTVLGTDPMAPQTIGLGTIIVTAPGHGKVGSFTVSFSGVVNTNNGVVIVGSNIGSYTATVIDADHYSIVATGSATNTDAFGGSDVIANYGSTAHIAEDMELHNITFRLTGARTVGSQEISLTTHCTGAKVQNTHFSSANSDDAVVTDNGISTVWGPGNTGGIWNSQQQITLPTDGSGYTLKPGDSGKMLLNPSNAGALNTVTIPDQAVTLFPPGFWVDVQANNATGANGVKFQTTTSGTISDANNNSSNPGSIASSTSGATLRLAWRSTSGWRVMYKIGTWTLA